MSRVGDGYIELGLGYGANGTAYIVAADTVNTYYLIICSHADGFNHVYVVNSTKIRDGLSGISLDKRMALFGIFPMASYCPATHRFSAKSSCHFGYLRFNIDISSSEKFETPSWPLVIPATAMDSTGWPGIFRGTLYFCWVTRKYQFQAREQSLAGRTLAITRNDLLRAPKSSRFLDQDFDAPGRPSPKAKMVNGSTLGRHTIVIFSILKYDARESSPGTVAEATMQANFTAGDEASLFTPPESPVLAPSSPSATVEGLQCALGLLENFNGHLRPDGMFVVTEKVAVVSRNTKGPRESHSQSALAKPAGRALTMSDPPPLGPRWRPQHTHPQTVAQVSYQHTSAPTLPPFPVWPPTEVGPSAPRNPHPQFVATGGSGNMQYAGMGLPGRMSLTGLHRDVPLQQALLAEPRVSGRYAMGRPYPVPSQIESYAAPYTRSTTGRSSTLSGALTPTKMFPETRFDGVPHVQSTTFMCHPVLFQAHGVTYYGAQPTEIAGPPAHGHYPGVPTRLPIPGLTANHSQQPTRSSTQNDVQVRRFLGSTQQSFFSVAQRPETRNVAAPAVALQHAPSTAHTTNTGNPPDTPDALSATLAFASIVPPPPTSKKEKKSKKRAAPAADLVRAPALENGRPQTAARKLYVAALVEAALPSHQYTSYDCPVLTMEQGIVKKCDSYKVDAADLQPHLVVCHGFPTMKEIEKARRTDSPFAKIQCVCGTLAPDGEVIPPVGKACKAIAVEKMGAHIASCHLHAYWFSCSACEGSFPTRKGMKRGDNSYEKHFTTCPGPPPPAVREGPPAKRRRLRMEVVDVESFYYWTALQHRFRLDRVDRTQEERDRTSIIGSSALFSPDSQLSAGQAGTESTGKGWRRGIESEGTD
ncbi:hypothetical protein B0H17DRAFT_1148873 [Mycena rosella]|uniref:Uncharacterized protein n=1 Tax=Mycena rosella TaxID=1033263 RepID=A0AAD7C6J7_MYCRO|nr:hypothetical protein B0H17DRAFT_1148873 [Mycena rosella]